MTQAEEQLGARIAAAAEGWLGVPWVHTGRDRLGVDCVGLLAVVAHDLGLTAYDDRCYSHEDAPVRLRGEIERFCARVEGEPRPGDVLLLRSKGVPSHCGIVTEDGQFVHAWNQRHVRRVVKHRLDRFWQARVVAIYRWRGEGAR